MRRTAAVALWCLAAILLIPGHQWLIGGVVWAASAAAAWSTRDPAFRLRMSVLLGCVMLLAVAPINTNTSDAHFLALGSYFFAAVVIPTLILGRGENAVIRFRLLPDRFRWVDAGYVALSIPVAWAGLLLYFTLSPEIAQNWALPPEPDPDALWRLFIGINAVGIWDELFFIMVSFATLRSILPFRLANAAQAVLYTSVLYTMAFRGAGPLFVYVFALTQGALFKRTENLIAVVMVHLIVDFFLFQEIVRAHYPGISTVWNFGL